MVKDKIKAHLKNIGLKKERDTHEESMAFLDDSPYIGFSTHDKHIIVHKFSVDDDSYQIMFSESIIEINVQKGKLIKSEFPKISYRTGVRDDLNIEEVCKLHRCYPMSKLTKKQRQFYIDIGYFKK